MNYYNDQLAVSAFKEDKTLDSRIYHGKENCLYCNENYA